MARPTLPNLTILLLCGLAELWCKCEARQMLHSCQGGNGLACPAESHSVLQTKASELTELDSEGDTLGEDLEKVSGMTQTKSEAHDLDEDAEQVAGMNQVDSEADDLDEDGEEVPEMNQVDSEAGDLDEDGEGVSEMNQADSEADYLDEEGEEFSEMTQVDSESDTLAGGVKHSGRGCWWRCRRKQGPCIWCGTGSCCRYGWRDKRNGCDGTFGIPRRGHVCVSTDSCTSFASSKACPDSRCIWSSGACQAPGALGVKNYGKGCWWGCRRKQGPCNWCGTGSCCRFGWRDKRNGCDGTLGIRHKGHVCTANPSMNLIPTTTTGTTTTTTSTTPSTTTSTTTTMTTVFRSKTATGKTGNRSHTEQFAFEGDYDTTVGNRKNTFLQECSTALKAQCLDVIPGSIILSVTGSRDDVDRAAAKVAAEGLELPSFGKLQEKVRACVDTTSWTPFSISWGPRRRRSKASKCAYWAKGRCENRAPKPGKSQYFGPKWKSPELNCCACGKGKKPTCAAHRCPNGYKTNPGVTWSRTLSDSSCCLPTCAQHSCASPLQKWVKYNPHYWKVPASDLTCCETTTTTTPFAGVSKARYVRIVPQAWHGSISTRAAVIMGEDLRVVDLPDDKRTFSSVKPLNNRYKKEGSEGHSGSYYGCSRIGLRDRRGWTAKHQRKGEWMQFDLGSNQDVRGVVIVGKPRSGCPHRHPHFLRSIKVQTATNEAPTDFKWRENGKLYNTEKSASHNTVRVVFTDTWPSCYESDSKYSPDDMNGTRIPEARRRRRRRSTLSLSACQNRCAAVRGCVHFSFSRNGECHLQDSSAVQVSSSGVTAGPPTCRPSNYVDMSVSTNACAVGSVISDVQVCQTAASRPGYSWKNAAAYSYLPKGCITNAAKQVTFNTDSVGATHGWFGPVCLTSTPVITTTQVPKTTPQVPDINKYPGTQVPEICPAQLYTDKMLCNDGTAVAQGECCPDSNSCPSGCASSGKSFAAGKTTCICKGCPRKRKLQLSDADAYVKAHNYFRCLHGHAELEWDAAVAGNAQIAATQSCTADKLMHSKSYKMTPQAGENLALGQSSAEHATAAWYNEITDPGYTPGTWGQQALSAGTGHYTALIWKSTRKLGCTNCSSGQGRRVWACQYSEDAPNSGNQAKWLQNVPQSTAPTGTPKSCCAKIYR